jgi:rubredoxin
MKASRCPYCGYLISALEKESFRFSPSDMECPRCRVYLLSQFQLIHLPDDSTEREENNNEHTEP